METHLPPCRFLYRSPPPAKVNSDIDNFFFRFFERALGKEEKTRKTKKQKSRNETTYAMGHWLEPLI